MITISREPLLSIPYQSEGFPDNAIKGGNVRDELSVTWGDILRSAITVGRPGWYYVFRHGKPSTYEAIFRWSLVKMALENSDCPRFLNRTKAARDLDPTEKGMVNYFLGMTFCTLFSSILLETPWLAHLDLFRPKLSGSRPDLVGYNRRMNQLYIFECKGRSSRPYHDVKDKAKKQAMRIASVDGISCTLRVAAITYFANDMLNFYWCDPPPSEDEGDQIELQIDNDVWQHYYGLVAELIAPSEREERTTPGDIIRWRDAGHWYARIEQCDVEVAVHQLIGRHLVEREWGTARSDALDATEQLIEDGFHADGLQVSAGPTWYQRGGEERSTIVQE